MPSETQLQPLHHEHSQWLGELYAKLSSVETFRVIPLTRREQNLIQLFLLPSARLGSGKIEPFKATDVFAMGKVVELRPDRALEPSFTAVGERMSDKSVFVLFFPHTLTYERLSILTYK